jgi:glycosyltransferase involved in cell wall biosynthesis
MFRQGSSDSRVLVCTPTYHSKIEWLDRAVKSLQSQTHSDFDCMLVKDGCRHAKGIDNCKECDKCKETVDFCESISDPRFKFFRLPTNCGAAGWGPRNFAILNTDHELISYLDDDNWLEPDHLESLFSLMQDGAEMAYTGTRLYDKGMEIIGDRVHVAPPAAGYVDTSEMMHKRSLIEKHGGWRYVPKCNDWDIVSRWKNVDWRHTGKVTLNFYVREGCGIHRQ